MYLQNVYFVFYIILCSCCLSIQFKKIKTSFQKGEISKLSNLIHDDKIDENNSLINSHYTTQSPNYTVDHQLFDSIKKALDIKLIDSNKNLINEINLTISNKTTEYKCKSSLKKIDVSLLCDGFSDCELGDDEENCDGNCSEQKKFQCKDDKKCIDLIFKCNSFPDCKDGSDENDCENLPIQTECLTDEFECSSGDCIHRIKLCDLINDCDDGSDELYCKYTCNENEFQCKDKKCIPISMKCNGQTECSDQSDEEGCLENNLVNYTCAINEFSCQTDPHKCIPTENICNDIDDCGNNADEPPECTMNLCKNHHCAHLCNQIRNSVKCSCNEGFKLSSNGVDCEDINECLEIAGFCSNHQCINQKNGSAICLCAPGYHFNSNENRCKVINGHNATLIYSNQNELRMATLSTLLNQVYLPESLQNTDDQAIKNNIIGQNFNSISMFVYDFSDNYIVWHDMNEQRLYIASLDKFKQPFERNEFFTQFRPIKSNHRISRALYNKNQYYLLLENITNVEDMTLDHVHDLLYWTNTDRNVIEVIEVRNPLKRKIIVNTDLDEPKGISVNVDRSFIIFTDWGAKPKIEYIKQDGTNRRTIYDKNLEWPYSIALDTYLDRIYWVDTKKNTLNVIDLDGENHQIILTSSMYLERANDLDIFEDKIYWSDQESESILSVDKFTPKSTLTVLMKDLKNVLSLKIVHYSKQQTTIQNNLCAHSGCEFMCLPRNDLEERKYTCACPDMSELNNDGLTCLAKDRSKTTKAISKNMYKIFGEMFDITDFYKTNTSAIYILTLAIFMILLVAIVCLYLIINYTKKKIDNFEFKNAQYQKTSQQDEKPLPHLEPLVDQPTTNEFI